MVCSALVLRLNEFHNNARYIESNTIDLTWIIVIGDLTRLDCSEVSGTLCKCTFSYRTLDETPKRGYLTIIVIGPTSIMFPALAKHQWVIQ